MRKTTLLMILLGAPTDGNICFFCEFPAYIDYLNNITYQNKNLFFNYANYKLHELVVCKTCYYIFLLIFTNEHAIS